MNKTLSERIEILGGAKAVASKICVDGEYPTAPAVTMWAQRGTIPWKWRAAFEALEAHKDAA
jgi:hypothetical protein